MIGKLAVCRRSLSVSEFCQLEWFQFQGDLSAASLNHWKPAFDGGATVAERFEGLMKDDEATSSGLLDEGRAEAVQFYVLAHRQMFRLCRLRAATT